jgi:hypothetical protein
MRWVGELLGAAGGMDGLGLVTAGGYLSRWEEAQKHNIKPSEPKV